ncbi:alanine racemase [Hahella chejuensis KCTC 2396]|uniref:Alanine racemase n=1 Tax=Hahella chejuensis (strain KCTC 2396) TaxID=349521 RepID=ALR_HAHCH|nr:alanine racemase [Hahella chejuensis]Q2SLB1.1 RecName: Full=Alanine racemase [Hahella chejuensis KCTC 2396]ABC28563.1 alanine racemase [Hahella chejuensis KCTC 2396]
MRPSRALIDLDALRHNIRLLNSIAHNARCAAVIKADAYGHGAVEIARALKGEAPKLAVACYDEAVSLREAGVTTPLLVLEGFYSSEELADSTRWCDIEWVVHDMEQLDMLSEVAPLRKAGPDSTRMQTWIKLNTGMNRLGLPLNKLAHVAEKLQQFPGLSVIGLMTHFACADELDSLLQQRQWRAFQAGMQAAGANGWSYSSANSAALLQYPETHLDWVRPGIAMYGASPMADKTGADFGLKPVMTFESRLIATRELQAGDSIGYGAAWTADAPTRMGVVAVGYGDGYPRQMQNGAPVAVCGKRTKIIGRVSMDMLTVDISHIPEARIGSEVELWGGTVSADEVAGYASTISYTLFTGMTSRVPRVYINRSEVV